jgi:hypothetical protein
MALMTSSTPPRGWPIESLSSFDTVDVLFYGGIAEAAYDGVPGSAAFADHYGKRFGPIANYAVNSAVLQRCFSPTFWIAYSAKGA